MNNNNPFLATTIMWACLAPAFLLMQPAHGQTRKPPASKDAEKANCASPADILQLLLEHRYDDLSAALETCRRLATQDMAANEGALTDAYGAFEQADYKLFARLDQWVEARPDSAEAYLARAICNDEMGWDARGGGFVKETSADQFALMEYFHKRAKDDLARALNLNPANPIAYRTTIGLARNTDQETYGRVIEKSLKEFPSSFALHWSALSGLQPRWGGSYEAIRELAERAQAHADANPRLKALLGYEDFAKARDADAADENERAYQLYTQAISHGEFAEYYAYRSYTALRLKRYADAIADADRATTLGKWSAESPYSPTQRMQAGLVSSLTQWSASGDVQSIQPLCAALAARWPDHTPFLSCHAESLLQTGKPLEALEVLKHALNLDPTQDRLYIQLTQAFRALSRDDELIPYITHWIELAPQKSAPYMMRGQIYGMIGDYALASADITKACELGDARACTMQKGLKAALKQMEDQKQQPAAPPQP